MDACDRTNSVTGQGIAKRLCYPLAILLGSACFTASAGESYQYGYITNVTFGAQSTLIMLSAGVPNNCTGTPHGWMRIPDTAKSLQAFVLGLWMRGDIAQIPVMVYTSPAPSAGEMCIVTQVDPPN